MTGFDSKRLLAFAFLGVFALRWIVHFVLFSDGVAVAEIAAMDVAALVVMVLSFALGPNVGTHIGSITLYFVVVGLAIVGFGYLAEWTRSRHLSNMTGLLCAIGAGMGLCLATKHWNQAIWVMGLVAVAGGSYSLTKIQLPLDAIVIASPYILLSSLFVVVGVSRPRPE